MPKTVGKKGGGKKKGGAAGKAKSRSTDKNKAKNKVVKDGKPKNKPEDAPPKLIEAEEEEDLEAEEEEEYDFNETSEEEEVEAPVSIRGKSKFASPKEQAEDFDEDSSWNDDGASGSTSSGSDEPYCPSGEYASSTSSDLLKSPSSMTLLVPDSGITDACTILEDMELGTVTKAAVRKCRGIEAAENEEDEEEVEEESNQKETPDFNFMTTYEEYLDHYVTSKDLYYFDSDDVARTITTLGFRVPELLTRDQFAEVMKDIQEKRFAKRKDDIHVAYGILRGEITCPLMQALAAREIQNRTGNMACLIYIRALNNKQQEVSGWIDFKLRLNKAGADVWTDYFTGKRKLVPRTSDLCYYNWTNFQVRYNSSDNYLVTIDIVEGLQFMNKLDMKLITVNPKVRPGDNTQLVKVKSPNYLDSGIYDHFLRIKA